MGINVGARWSAFSSFGHHIAWQAGLHWQPSQPITLSADYATVFRTPSLFELFEPRTLAAEGGFDPCGHEPTPQQRTHCAANGVPGGAYQQGAAGFAVGRGGNPQLQPEKGQSFGIGVRYAPVTGLAAQLEFYEIGLAHVVGTTDIDTLLFECAGLGIPESCSPIHRFPDGSLARVTAFNENLGKRTTSAIDFTLDWDTGTHFGKLSTGLVATYLAKWDETPFPGGDLFHHAGRLSAGALPRWRAAGHVDVQRGPWLASYSAEFIGGMSEEVLTPPTSVYSSIPTHARASRGVSRHRRRISICGRRRAAGGDRQCDRRGAAIHQCRSARKHRHRYVSAVGPYLLRRVALPVSLSAAISTH